MVIYEKIDVPCSKVYFKGMTMPTFLHIYIYTRVCVYSRTREKENRDGRRNQVEAGWFGREKGERVHKIVGVTI